MADQLPSPPCKPKPTLVTLDSDILIQLLCNLRDARNKLKPTSKSTSKHPLDPISRTCKHLRLLSLPYLYSEIFVREEEREKKVKWVNATNKLKRLNAEDVFILKYVRKLNFSTLLKQENCSCPQPPSGIYKTYSSNDEIGTPTWTDNLVSVLPLLLARTILLMPKLQTLNISVPRTHFPAYDGAFKCLQMELQGVNRLEIETICWPSFDFVPALESVYLRDETLGYYMGSDLKREDHVLAALEKVLKIESLKELKIDCKWSEKIAKVISTTPNNIQRLGTIKPQLRTPLSSILEPLGRITHLKSLKLGNIFELDYGFHEPDSDDWYDWDGEYGQRQIAQLRKHYRDRLEDMLRLIETCFGEETVLEEIWAAEELLFERRGGGEEGRKWTQRSLLQPSNSIYT